MQLASIFDYIPLILIGFAVFFVVFFLIMTIMKAITGSDPENFGGGFSALLAIVATFFICKFINNNFLGGKQAATMVKSYAQMLPTLSIDLASPQPQPGTFGILILDRDDKEVLQVRGDEMRKIPAECRANPMGLPEVVLFYGTSQVVTGHCTGACPGGSKVTKEHYWYSTVNLARGVEIENNDADREDLKQIVQDYCPQFR